MSIKRSLLAVTLLLSLSAIGAKADPLTDDPLHGDCTTGSNATCGADNGNYSPITAPLGASSVSGFGWTASPGPQTGNLDIVVLVPTQLDTGFSGLSITGTGIGAGGDALNQVAGTFTSGDLASFLGIPNSSPNNPVGGFETGLDSQDSSFDVYQVSTLINGSSLPSPGSNQDCTNCALTDIFTLSGALGTLPAGVDIVAFLLNSSQGGTTATALSGQLQLQDSVPFNHVHVGTIPEPASLSIFGSALIGMFWLSRRRRQSPPARKALGDRPLTHPQQL
jgi:hypothetical protein